jgi:site-specific DNA-cytosine methylase
MRYLSICSGLGGAELAFEPLGWECAGVSEVDAAACAVLQTRWPNVNNFGDFTKIGVKDVGAIDLLVGGTPCQDFSVAGLRAGIEGDRGNLTLEFIRLAERIKPKYVVWENVPGILTVDEGGTIQKVIDSFTQIGYICDVDIHDAQWFGVPQRRRRVFLVCVKLEDLLHKKTSISDRIMAELLVQALLSTWDAALEVLSHAKSLSESEPKIVPSVDFLQKKMELLDTLLGGSAGTKLLDYWDDLPVQSTGERSFSESISLQSSERRTADLKMVIGGSQSVEEADEFGCKSTALWWKSVMNGISDQTNQSITSTWTVETMKTAISSFAAASVTMLLSIINSQQHSLSGNWSSDYWNLASLLLTLTKGITNYARSANCELFSVSSVRNNWGDCLQLSPAITDIVERHIGDWRDSKEVLLVEDRLCGHPPPRKEKGQRVAGCLKGGSGERGWSDPSDGNGEGMVEVRGATGRGDGGIDGAGESISKWPAEIASTLDERYGKNYGQENQHINSGASHFVPVTFDDQRGRANSGIGIDQARTLHSAKGQSEVQLVAFTQNSRDEVRVLGEDGEVAGSLSAEPGTHQTTYLAFDPTQVTSKTNRSNPQVGDPCHTLAKGAQPPAICIKGAAIGRKPEAGPQYGEILEDDSTYTLNATEQHAVAYGCYDEQTPKVSEDVMPTLRGRRESGGEMQFVAYEPVGFIHPRQLRGSETSNQVGIKPDADISDALTREGPGAVSYHIQDQNTGKSIKAKLSDVATCLGTRDLSKYQGTFNADVIQSVMQVRRLTPVECSRLQGVPDLYLDITYRGKPLADGLKYKLIGNGFAVPCVFWIGKRIQMVEELINGIS